jgi:23S rRNA (adenine2030-N6)-methyltransferase
VKYRHGFHAGNFADAVKHLVLLAILKSLARKSTPFFYLDTHAGRGRYKLTADSREYLDGFARLRGQAGLPALIAEYVEMIERLGNDGQGGDGQDEARAASPTLTSYPGSPLIATALMRPGDRAVLFELLADEAERLRMQVPARRNVTVQCGDGYTALRSQLPPRERRGLVLIDPAYELQEAEFTPLLTALQEGHRRWPSGIFAIWYPIKHRAPVQRLHAALERTGIRRIMCAQLCLHPDDSRVSLNGCGMIIINPPWQLDTQLQAALPVLHRQLGGQPRTGAGCFWLAPE